MLKLETLTEFNAEEEEEEEYAAPLNFHEFERENTEARGTASIGQTSARFRETSHEVKASETEINTADALQCRCKPDARVSLVNKTNEITNGRTPRNLSGASSAFRPSPLFPRAIYKFQDQTQANYDISKTSSKVKCQRKQAGYKGRCQIKSWPFLLVLRYWHLLITQHFSDMKAKMMVVMLTTSLLLTGTTLALPADPPHVYDAPVSHSFHPDPAEVHEPYDFAYTVRDDESGADFAHSEASDGASVRGSYTVLLPDGRKQTVTYVVDPTNGYTAHVTYSGDAHRPATFGSAVIPTAKTYRPQTGF
ncbi:uncharacterized protein [Penaeus vannamei]|uniref:uncharacterized protein n=1 Tax=Penaeus vannamei TaxID=6689 RepID=UPI00387F529A